MKVYLAGPMRGKIGYNLDEFDKVRNRWKDAGHLVFCPAMLVRAMPYGPSDPTSQSGRAHVMQVDLSCIMQCEAIVLLPGWEDSAGVSVELAMAQFLGLIIYDSETMKQIHVPSKPWGRLKLAEKAAEPTYAI